MIEWLKLVFQFLISTNKVVEKSLPSEKIQEERFEVTKPTLTEAQVKKIADKRNKLADEMFGDLRRHPELSVWDKVNFECKELDSEEKILLQNILIQRLDADPVYNRLKNKKSKFKL